MPRIGVGLIGCGDIARVRYLPAIEALPDFEFAGVYSRTAAACEAIVARYGGRAYSGLDAFLGDRAIDAVVIATPHPSHADLSVAALNAGKHVLCEKPIATSVADAMRIREAAKRAKGVFMPLPFDGLPPMREAKRLMETGAIGIVSSADAVLAHQGPQHAPWFFDRKQAGWGVLADLGIYLVSQLTYLFGPAESVFGRFATRFPERRLADGKPIAATVDDNIAGILNLPDGIIGSVRANWCSPADHRNFIWEVTVYGTKGVIFINMASPERSLVVYSPGNPIQDAEPVVHNGMTECYAPRLPAWDHHLDIMRAFAEAIRRGKSAEDEREIARQEHVVEIVARLYESSQAGIVQTLSPQ